MQKLWLPWLLSYLTPVSVLGGKKGHLSSFFSPPEVILREEVCMHPADRLPEGCFAWVFFFEITPGLGAGNVGCLRCGDNS